MNVGEDKMTHHFGLKLFKFLAFLYYFEKLGGPKEKIFCST